jgi:hypothetical protein
MTETKIKRSNFATFLNTTPDSTATWSLIGAGIPSAEIEYNPKTAEEHDIDDDSGSKFLESYSPSMPVEGKCVAGDPAFEYIDDLRKERAVLGDAETQVCNVWMYETGGPNAYPAETQAVAIAIEKMGGPGGEQTGYSYTLHYIGDPTAGTFDAETLTFSES